MEGGYYIKEENGKYVVYKDSVRACLKNCVNGH
jgi:hypothetical protein